MDSKELFTSKSKIYDAYRPKYSEQFIDSIIENYPLSHLAKIADIGAGTGILTQQLLRIGCEIFAIEPNKEMREIAENKFLNEKKCHVINGSAEKTTLNDNSMDLIIVAQAFHWFEIESFRKEFQRISKRNKAILVWNTKKTSQPYLAELEEVNQKYCKEFKGFSGGIEIDQISSFFDNHYIRKEFENNLRMKKHNFVNGILTGSYTPDKEDKDYEAYVQKIEEIFEKYCINGELIIENDTIAYSN